MNKKQILKGTGLSILAIAVISKLIKDTLSKRSAKNKLQSKAARKNQQILTQIQMTSSLAAISPALQEQILSSTISELQSLLDSKSITCTDIFLSFTHELRTSSSSHNCVSDINFALGYKRAQKLDYELESGKKRSPLHGIPMSIKDFIAVKGMNSSYGCMNECFSVEENDADLVKILKKKGVNIYVKGTMSQNAHLYETVNGITGTTLNPINKERSAGGSSGGDAVLVATRGTCAAIGTDIGGSLRFPSLSCGLFTLKPTSYRITRAGPLSLQDYPHFKNAWGPITKNLDDLILICQEIFNEKPSAYLPFLPWRNDSFTSSSQLIITICEGSDYWPIPSCLQAPISQVHKSLEARGHLVKLFKLTTEIEEVTEIALGVTSYGSKDLKRLAGEDLHPQLSKIEKALNSYPLTRPIKEKIIKYTQGEKESVYYKVLNHKNVDDYLKNIIRLRVFKEKFLKAVNSDIVIFPYAFPAVPHNSSQDLLPGFSYLSIFNILDWPVGHLPIGFVQTVEPYLPENQEIWAEAMRNTLKNSEGLPVGVQVAGLPFQEEKVLRIMKELSEDLER